MTTQKRDTTQMDVKEMTDAEYEAELARVIAEGRKKQKAQAAERELAEIERKYGEPSK